MSDRLKNILKYFAAPAVVTLIAFIVALNFMGPPPPKTIVFAAGQPGGAYYSIAESYRDILAEYDVEVVIRESQGSVENLSLLQTDEADVALIQAGIAGDAPPENLRALGAVMFEPLWVFVRRDTAAVTLGDLQGLRVSIGSEGSGTRAMMVLMGREWGVEWSGAAAQGLTSSDAVAGLQAGTLDGAAFVASPRAGYIAALMSDPEIMLLPFDRAPALARRLPYLAPTELYRGAIDVGEDLPREDVPLIATTAMLVVDEDTHPAIQAILLDAAHEIHRRGSLLNAPGAFPNRDLVDLPISDEAERYYERGPSALRRIFPFGVANFLERAWVLAIPLLTLMIPLVRIAPPLYRWRVRRKIYVWYRDLRDLEALGRKAERASERREVKRKLAEIQAETGRLEVPLSYTDDLYRLRNHIAFVIDLMDRLEQGEQT